jgi:hypothetical protein
MARRDEFGLNTKRVLADRVGHVCSNPDCRVPTSGPRLESDRAVMAGDAGHITAAALNGPRFDPTLTTAQRRHADNGIWLCVTCARIVDHDKSRYTVDQLQQWKSEAEALAQRRLGKPHDLPRVGGTLWMQNTHVESGHGHVGDGAPIYINAGDGSSRGGDIVIIGGSITSGDGGSGGGNGGAVNMKAGDATG